jgi:hypothetical protein
MNLEVGGNVTVVENLPIQQHKLFR